MSISLKGKVALVTGASRGIGFAVAKAYASAGANVHIVSECSDIHSAAETLSQQTRSEVIGHVCDISDRFSVGALAKELPRLHIVVNNAGLEKMTPVDDQSVETFEAAERVFRVNILGTWNVTQAVVPVLFDGGSMIFTASIWSRTSEAGFSAYAASKHSTLGFVRTWSKELGSRGIRVNAVAPGWVRTDAALLSLSGMARDSGRTEEELTQDILQQQSLPGLMEPGDVVGAFVFLACELSTSITGQSIQVDRGAFSA